MQNSHLSVLRQATPQSLERVESRKPRHISILGSVYNSVAMYNLQKGRCGEGRKKDTPVVTSLRLLQIYIFNTTSFDINKVQYVLCLECYRLPRVQRGGVKMDNIINFVVAVMAGVVCHCINKWLDGDK